MARDEDSSTHDARKLTEADRFVGQKLRQARREIGLTQDKLAASLGVTFQQIQKYEAGHSRIAAGRLRDIAIAVQKPIEFFFEPIAGAGEGAAESSIRLQLRDLRRDAKRLVDQIENPDDLKTVVRLLEMLDRLETSPAPA
jgi:transcriptional regulator with XRE-family HTH domain